MKTYLSRALARQFMCALLMLSAGATYAQTAELSNLPLVGASSSAAPPNIMLLLDTSNSMAWTHMPDQMEVVGSKQRIGYKASECNALYYNRNRRYAVPKDAAGAALPTPSFTSAPYNYFINTATTVNLSTSFRAHDANTVQNVVTTLPDTEQAAYYFYFEPSGAMPAFTYNTAPCNTVDSTSPGTSTNVTVTGGQWRRVVVSSTSGPAGYADERQNFAIWYTYYRTRMNSAKSSIGLAFQSLSDSYRVGLLTVNPTLDANNVVTNTVQPSKYTPLGDFNVAQRTLWYNKFYGQRPVGSSPAREALARVGRHYAGKTDGINLGMDTDPVQYACQKNFTIMTTDGNWNVAAEKPGVAGGPTNIDGTAWVGQRDGGATYPRTSDTDPAGLVPSGVFDGTLSQLPYTRTATTLTTYDQPACNYAVPGSAIVRIQQDVRPQIRTVVTTPPQNVTTRQARTVSFTKQSWKVTKQTLQYVIPMATKTTTQLVRYDPASEQSVPVVSCSGYTNCGPSGITGSTSVPSGTCVAQNADASNAYTRVVCTGATTAIQTSACTPGVGGCQVNVIFPPTHVGATSCTAGNSGAPNYYITTCTENSYNSAAPSVTESSPRLVETVNACVTSYGTLNVLCSYASTTAWVNSPSCTAATLTGTTARECQNVSSCSTTVAPFPTSCTGSTVTTANVACVGGTTGTTATGTTVTSCSYGTTVSTAAVNPATCPLGTAAPSAANGFNEVKCTSTTSAITPLGGGTCPEAASAANGWQQKICAAATVTGWRTRSRTTRNETWTYDNGTVVLQPPVVSPYVDLESCRPLPVVVTTPPLPNPVVAAPVYVPYSSTGGSTNSLADVAQYYYTTDLRPSMANIVPPSGTGALDDRATWQHMTTFVVGLGVSGTLPYKPDYASSGTGSFADIRSGAQSWPVWPDPTLNYTTDATLWNSPKSIDDFWHTAVNGRGKYFSAADPDSVVSGIRETLSAINASVGEATSTTISDQVNITEAGLNFASSYTTEEWVGDVQAVDSSAQSTIVWSAKAKLNAQTQAACDDRKIYVRDPSTASKLGPFTLNTRNCTTNTVTSALSTAIQGLISATSLTQYATMTTAPALVDQRAQATVSSLVNYLRGQRQNEGFAVGQSGKLYRARTNVLGDIVNSKPQFVGAPYFDYADDGYYEFKTVNANRQNMIYVGANDGMLHAIYAPPATATPSERVNEGKEAWAYIPTQVIPSLSRLADVNYGSNHRFFVDGTPTVADVKFADGSWHTILVGGLRGGGKGYYALDITNPESPKSLWEFDSSNCGRTGCSVGNTYGQPVVGKLADGTWAVFMTSGYNNSTGQAALFIVNAETGVSIKTINAGAANTGSPLGLAPISAWSDYPTLDRTVTRVYGGDLKGNVWRFQVNDTAVDAVYRIAVAKDPDGNVQPITMPPELGKIGRKPYVYVGTGRLLGASDFANVQRQTVYAIQDDLAQSNSTVNLRSVLTPYRTTQALTIECAANCTSVSDSGFLIDLIGTGEKVIIPVALVNGQLVVITTQPQDNTCGTSGKSKIYFVNASDGTTAKAGEDLSDTVVGVTYVNRGGKVYAIVRYGSRRADDTNGNDNPFNTRAVQTSGQAQPDGDTRSSWREYINR